MSANTVDRLHLAVLDGQQMDDATLARLVPECRSLTAFTTGDGQAGLAQRWAAIAPGTELIDGGRVADLREALVECAKRRIVVISTGVPADPASFVAHALQGAAAMTEFDVPGVAVHVMRPVERPGSVAWLTDTGELSGYGVLFAVGYAHLHSTSVDLIEPSSGLGRPRTAEALDDALAFAEAAGVPITRHTDPSPFARVLRDEHCMVVHPVLDAPKGFNLLHPGELSRKAVASGNPAVVVELIEKFPGDVVAVFDGVHLLQGSIPAARIAAGVALGVVAAAGVGTMVASPASAAGLSAAAPLSVSQPDSSAGIGVSIAGPHRVTVSNSTDSVAHVSILVTMTAGYGGGHGGSGGHTSTHTKDVVLQPHATETFEVISNQGHSITGAVVEHVRLSPGTVVQTPETTHVVVVNESELTVTPARGPGALVDEKDPTTMLQPNAPQQQVPQETPTPTPMAVPTLKPTLEPPVIQQTPPPITQETPTPMAVPTLKPTLEPPVIQQTPPPITQETPTPMAVPTLKPTLEPPVIQQTPPPITQETPTPMAVPTLKPTLEPPVIQQTPPPITQQTPTPMAVPTLQPTLEPPVIQQTPPPITQQTPTPMAVPTLQAQPMLVPPLQATPTEVVTDSVPAVVAGGVVTPDLPVDVGSSVVTPAVTTEAPTTEVAPTVSVTTSPGEVSVQTTTTQQAGTPHHATHHASHPGQVTTTAVDGDHAPAGELAHTGGNTAILAIVAGSLLAAGAGLAVAGRMGKDDPDTGATEG